MPYTFSPQNWAHGENMNIIYFRVPYKNVLRAVIIEMCFLLHLIQYLNGLVLGSVRYQDGYAIQEHPEWRESWIWDKKEGKMLNKILSDGETEGEGKSREEYVHLKLPVCWKISPSKPSIRHNLQKILYTFTSVRRAELSGELKKGDVLHLS